MSETSERYRRLADAFSERVRAVPGDAWERPSPCEGWVARDVVRHMVETSERFLGRAGMELPAGPSVDDDPADAWDRARSAVQAALEDPAVADQSYDTPMGAMTFEETMSRFGVADVLIHTWDLARATGLDERLDPDESARVHEQLLPNDAMMRGPAFGPRVDVSDDADVQTRLLAFTGRQP